MSKQGSSKLKYLNLKGISCPVNFIRSSLAAETLELGDQLKIDLDKGEPERMVISGLLKAGYKIKVINDEFDSITLLVSSGETSIG